MARVEISESIPVSPDECWAVVSDLNRLGEWMPMHEAWRGDVPDELAVGTELTGVVRSKGIRNRVTWVVEEFDPPTRVAMAGNGVGGTKVSMSSTVVPDGSGSRFDLEVEFSHPTLRGPMSKIAERQIRGDLSKALKRFVDLV